MLPSTAEVTSVTTTPKPPATPSVIPTPARQLADLPREELDHLAEDFGLDPTKFKTRQHLVAALHDRRQMIAGLDREAMLDVIRWGRRPIALNASNEQIAQEIARITSMRFHGLSQRGLVVLARMRGIEAHADDPIPELVRMLKKQEGLFAKLARKRRAMMGSIVANMIGEAEPGAGEEYQYLPQGQAPAERSAANSGQRTATAAPPPPQSPASLKRDIEESGLFGGISNRIKKTADNYLNQKLDEVEARIDRKLDEIDRRLAEWRDKEVANRIRILKITLWLSVIVGAFSLIYSYIKVYFVGQ